MPFQSQLEPGFRCVPISPAEATSSLRLCVVVRETAEPASGHFVFLQQTLDARVLLGAITDAAGGIREWVELWYQDVADETVNAVRDRNWQQLSRSIAQSEPEAYFAMPTTPREPVWLDAKGWQPQLAATPDGAALALCTDDQTLTAAGLPAYSGSAARFGRNGAEGKFFALNEAARGLPGAEPASGTTGIPLNPGAGALLVRRFSPLPIDDFADILGGRAWSGLTNAKKVFRLQGIYREFTDEAAIRTKGRHFLGTRRDIAGRLVETLYLKMTLIRQCIRRIREETQRTDLPLLNVEASSFRVNLGVTETELPYCWSAHVALVRPGESKVIDVPGSHTKYFTTRAGASVSIFRPEELGLARKGRGSVRLRRMLKLGDGGTVAEGTLIVPDRVPVGTNELLQLTLPLAGDKTFTLVGSIDPSAALAPGETGFRTIPMDLDASLDKTLRSYEGTPLGHIPYEVIPPLSSPCDLYSLGVLALRILFAGSTVSLPVALDVMLSLGRSAAGAGDEKPLAQVVAEILESDPRWLESLGPQHVLKDATDSTIPLEIWSSVLALLVRFFPGLGPFSFCADLAAAPTEAQHAIFADPLDNLDILLLRLRSLCFSNWRENNEVAALLASYLA